MNQGALPRAISTHAPAGGATHGDAGTGVLLRNFYSRPCGRGDTSSSGSKPSSLQFLLTPLREGRRAVVLLLMYGMTIFLLTPLREGRLVATGDAI